jgi:hypothetical protein
VCPSLIYGFLLPLWYLPTLLCPFGHCVVTQHNGQKDKEELEDTKGVIRIYKSKKDRQHNGQKDKEVLEDTKEVIRIHKS